MPLMEKKHLKFSPKLMMPEKFSTLVFKMICTTTNRAPRSQVVPSYCSMHSIKTPRSMQHLHKGMLYNAICQKLNACNTSTHLHHLHAITAIMEAPLSTMVYGFHEVISIDVLQEQSPKYKSV